MSSQLHAELIRVRQHEIAVAAAHAQHRHELRTTRRGVQSPALTQPAGLPRIVLIASLILSMLLAVVAAAI